MNEGDQSASGNENHVPLSDSRPFADEMYQVLYEQAPVMSATMDTKTGRIVDCNQQLLAVTGFSKSELVGRHVLDIYDGDSRATASAALERLIETGRVHEDELQLRHKDGTMTDVALNASTVSDPRINTTYGNLVWQDVTARKREERSLQQSRGQLQAILDHTTAVIYVKDVQGRYLLINRRFEELFHITRNEVRGKTDHEVFSKAQADAFRANDVQVLQEGVPVEFEEVAPHPDGLHTYLSIKFPIFDSDSQRYGVCGISSDITRRKHAEAALAESEQRFRQFAESIEECVWITQVDSWDVLYVSPAFERIWGRSCETLYENSDIWLEAVHPADRDRVGKAFFRDIIKGDYNEEYRVLRPDGSIRWIWDRGMPIRDDDGNVYRVAGIAEDITERRLLQTEVSNISNREQQRISSELHDSLGQELTGLGYLAKSLARKLLAQSTQEASAANTIADGIQTALMQLGQVVRGLAPVELDAEGLRAALQQLATTTEERSGIQCFFHGDHEVPVEDNVVATHLYRIAQEAVSNSVKHANAARIDIYLEMRTDCLSIQVRDDGDGFAIQRDTQPGMGLRIMQYRCGIIDANLDIQSPPGGGTSVSCVLKGWPATSGGHGK